MRWVWAITPPSVLVIVSICVQPALIHSTAREHWIRLVILNLTVQGLLAGWAGWRVTRKHAGGVWAASLAGGAALAAGYFFIFGLAFVTAPLRPQGFQEFPIDPAALGGVGLMALAATALGFVGSKVAAALGGRNAT